MGKITGFLEFTRELPHKRPPEERVNDYKEFIAMYSEQKLNQQAARCMDCGTPFCHDGCPVGNLIPEFNDAVYRQSWQEAYEILSSTNNSNCVMDFAFCRFEVPTQSLPVSPPPITTTFLPVAKISLSFTSI